MLKKFFSEIALLNSAPTLIIYFIIIKRQTNTTNVIELLRTRFIQKFRNHVHGVLLFLFFFNFNLKSILQRLIRTNFERNKY